MQSNKTSAAVKLLIFSALGSAMSVLVSCYLWTDFELDEIANIMFWIGAVVIIIGGSNFFPGSDYQGQSEASMFLLRFKNVTDRAGVIEKKERQLTMRSIKGASIALPGIVLIAIASML